MESTGKVPDIVGWVDVAGKMVEVPPAEPWAVNGRKTDPSHAKASLEDLGEAFFCGVGGLISRHHPISNSDCVIIIDHFNLYMQYRTITVCLHTHIL